MGAILILGFLVAASLVALIFRIGARTVFGYGAVADVAALVILALLFHGTFQGMSVAIVAGLFFSGAIYLVRRQIGYRTYDLRRRAWREVPPDPITMPDLPSKPSLARRIGIWFVSFCIMTLALFGMVNAFLGPYAAVTLAPGVTAAAAILALSITRNLSR